MLLHRGTDLPPTDKRHATDEMVERYSMGRLEGPELEEFEEHLLVCEVCQDRLAFEDAFREGIRAAAGRMLAESQAVSAVKPWAWANSKKPAWVLGLAACGILSFATIQWAPWQRATGQPTVLLLHAMRGTESASAAAGKPLMLTLDLSDLPVLSEYKVEVVDATGHPALQSRAIPQSSNSRVALNKGLPTGAYFARLYSPAGELLREYSLTIRP